MHRVDLQLAMADRCRELGVTISLSSKALCVDFATATVSISRANGTETVTIAGDVVICADGLWSSIRSQFLQKPSPAILTGDLAYRIVINTNDMRGPDAESLKSWIRGSSVNFWIGPSTHVVAYTMRGGDMYNIVLLCPDTLPAGVSKSDGDVSEMKALFDGWDPILRRFLDQVEMVAKWKLMHIEALPEWASPDGRVLMVGDCCHPMLPYLAQGANSSLEDGAVLGSLLGKVMVERKDVQLPVVAERYQGLRKERGELIGKETFKQRQDFHLPDGPEQQERDVKFSKREEEVDGGGDERFPSRWTCPRVQKWLYGYDAYAEFEKSWKENPF